MRDVVYMPYRMLRDKCLRLAKPGIVKEKKKKSRDELVKQVLGDVFRIPGMNRTIDANVMVDEEEYVNNGCQMYFPESPALLEMLWRAKMDINLHDLNLGALPNAFSIAWPRCEIDGVQTCGCLVTVMTGNQYVDVFKKFGLKILGRPLDMLDSGRVPRDEVGLHLTYWGDKNVKDSSMPYLYHCSIPDLFLRKCLKSEGNYGAFLGNYDNEYCLLRGADTLSDEEKHRQFVMVRLTIHLLVYMQACPEHLRDGLPDGRRRKEFVVGEMNWVPQIIGGPAGLGGTHASPSAHFRTWHFRNYPKKKDGTRKKGAVFVKATVVNADINPKTVEEDL